MKEYLKLIITDKYHNIRYDGAFLYTEKELKNNNLKSLIKLEYFNKYPDDKFLDKNMLDAIFEEITCNEISSLKVLDINIL